MQTVMIRFEEISHTADMGIRAFGADFEELLRNAADGMFSLVLSDTEALCPSGTEYICVEAKNREILLHTWLSELLFLHSVRKILPLRYELTVDSETMFHERPGEPASGNDVAAETRTHRQTREQNGNDRRHWKLRATMTYAEMTREQEMQATEIKAVTWHAFFLDFDGVRWRAEAVFDT
jgi:SHS2 domain-containing protein